MIVLNWLKHYTCTTTKRHFIPSLLHLPGFSQARGWGKFQRVPCYDDANQAIKKYQQGCILVGVGVVSHKNSTTGVTIYVASL